jgi:lysozyme family protein
MNAVSPDALFDEVIERRVRPNEGGYVNHPSDRGGPTIHGITEAVARAFGYAGPMKAMTWPQAVEIYRARYWTQPRFHLIAPISAPIAGWMLDTGINMGTSVPVSMGQRLLNALNERGRTYPDLTVDGNAGAMTRFALAELIRRRGQEPVDRLLPRALAGLQLGRYLGIMEGDVTQEDFGWGWLTRAFG